MPEGGCHCGAIRYRASGEVRHNAICHCSDCRGCAGATGVAWIAFAASDLEILCGTPQVYVSSRGTERHFCGTCGTGLFYFNEAMLPGIVDIQTATLDEAADYAPTAHIQMADALPWEIAVQQLPRFERFPG